MKMYLTQLIARVDYIITVVDTNVFVVEKMFDVNVFELIRIIHYFHRPIVEVKSLIINIGFVDNIFLYVFGVSYNASKIALAYYKNIIIT